METSHFHPMLVHFPIALLVAGFLYDAITLFFCKEHKLSKAGLYLMVLGTLGAWAAYLTGEFFTSEMAGAAGEVREMHELFAKITMYSMFVISILRIWVTWKKKEATSIKWLVFLLYAAASACVGYTGFLGGNLVYNFMVGL